MAKIDLRRKKYSKFKFNKGPYCKYTLSYVNKDGEYKILTTSSKPKLRRKIKTYSSITEQLLLT